MLATKSDRIDKIQAEYEWLRTQVKQGKAFMARHELTIGGAATGQFLFTVGAKDVILTSCQVGSDDTGATVALYETPTVTNVGTGVTEYNRDDRQTTPGNLCTMTYTPTTTANGTTLQLDQVTLNQRDFCDMGWIRLKANTVYHIAITTPAGGQGWANLEWIES